jgi:hypothetical protein
VRLSATQKNFHAVTTRSDREKLIRAKVSHADRLLEFADKHFANQTRRSSSDPCDAHGMFQNPGEHLSRRDLSGGMTGCA